MTFFPSMPYHFILYKNGKLLYYRNKKRTATGEANKLLEVLDHRNYNFKIHIKTGVKNSFIVRQGARGDYLSKVSN